MRGVEGAFATIVHNQQLHHSESKTERCGTVRRGATFSIQEHRVGRVLKDLGGKTHK